MNATKKILLPTLTATKKIMIQLEDKKMNVMKLYLTLLSIIMSASMCSCSTNTEEIVAEEIPVKEITELRNNPSYIDFKNSIDSLNNVYLQKNNTTKGSFWTSAGIYAADSFGEIAGFYAGRYLGAALGCITANPVVGVVGYTVGGYAGSLLGGCIASGVAGQFLGYSIKHNNPTLYNFNFTLFSDQVNDSLGFYHNNIMREISLNSNNYYQNDTLDVELLYEDIIACCFNNGFYCDVFYSDSYKQSFINSVKDVSNNCKDHINNTISYNEVIQRNCNLLRNMSVSENYVEIYADICNSLGESFSALNENDIFDYTAEYNKLIVNSSLDDETKIAIIGVAQIYTNSYLCWKE